jgi:NADPH:quinone reductase-like Zn-dependent oxidoreductase
VKAVVYDRYGPPEVLELREIRKPEPAADQLLIRVRAAEATKADVEMRRFRFAVKWFWLPMRLNIGIRRPRRQILGVYFSGVVESVGDQIRQFAPGDEVFGCTRLRVGAYAEYIALPARYTIVSKPRNMSFAEAAAVPLGGLNALHFLRLAKVQTGERVLINGAGGAIGAYAVQIAKAMGAEVTAVDAGHKEAGLRGLGADHFIDYSRTDFTAMGATYDVIFDMVPESSYAGCMRALTPTGRYLCGNPRLLDMLRCAVTNRFSRRQAWFRFAGETREELQSLRELIEAGRIGAIVDTVYPMAQAAEAHRRVEAEQRVGAIVIAMADEPA